MDTLRRRIVAALEKVPGTTTTRRSIADRPAIRPDRAEPVWEINADLASVRRPAFPRSCWRSCTRPSSPACRICRTTGRIRSNGARGTLGYVLTTTFGNTEAATALIEHVKHVHSYVNGTRPDGVPYRALDPELIGWVHTCIPWMIMRAFEHTKRPLSQAERDRYLAEQAVIGRMGGADRVPTTAAELDDYVEAMRPRLSVNAQTREFIDFLITSPFFGDLPGPLDRQLHRFAIYAGMSRAPQWARELIGFDHPSAMARRLMAPALQFDARRLRWAFGTPRYVELASRRASGATRPEAAAV